MRVTDTHVVRFGAVSILRVGDTLRFDTNKAESFYVGNSAGRKTDGNDVDRQFAERLGLKFFTEAFLKGDASTR
ncbi:hypothetical protein AK812_SmicGene2179 [Symbiodinium microadriaticum]|uniref:Uncharacterized protein n=1 Tax=Symbiodinium microadriaticum TaxID=2951 RepID=A0A1Q9F2H4_SYMMI|nr:hypothetical protein AK812_SmicGene2179 [Symbiodinium microadriaticum]